MDDFTSRVNLQKIIDEKELNVIYTPDDPSQIMISSSDVNRPGLALAGFFDHFERKRIQIIGNAEAMYIKKMDETQRRERLTDFSDEILWQSSLRMKTRSIRFPASLRNALRYRFFLQTKTQVTLWRR